MTIITLNKESAHKRFEYEVNPIIHINKVVKKVNVINQDNAVSETLLSIRITAYSNDNLELAFETQYLPLIIPLHSNKPVLEINKTYKLGDIIQKGQHPKKWTLDFKLENIKAAEQNNFEVHFLDNVYIKKRVDDWQFRIQKLIETFRQWAARNPTIEIRDSRKYKMHEGLMKDFEVPMREITTVDIIKNGKITLVLKPFGLWVMGANGRIDLLSNKGNYVLVDQAEKFQAPEWMIFLDSNKTKGVPFSQEVFYNLVNI